MAADGNRMRETSKSRVGDMWQYDIDRERERGIGEKKGKGNGKGGDERGRG